VKHSITVFLVPALIAAGLLISGCSQEQKVRAASISVKLEPPADPDTYTVDKPELFPLVDAVSRATHDDVPAPGAVAPDVNRTVAVNSLSGGRVIDLRARLGDDVKKGQLLLRISSSDLASAFSDYEKAVSDEILARRALNRTRELYDHGAAPLKDVEAAEDTEQKAQVDLRTTAERIRILGGDVNNPSSVLEVYAPVSGTIVEQNVAPAGGIKSLDNAPNLFTIADLSSVWVLCDVYENNLSQVHLGDFANIRFNAYPDRTFRGRISNIGRILDPGTRTAKVRLELANPGGLLRPGMFASVEFVSAATVQRIVIPASAILRLHDKDWVFRPAGSSRFRRQEIQGGEVTPDGNQFVLDGLRAGDLVVRNALEMSSTVEK
jgi:cobalt-zinc-cadmium efflux system membrane fusion protein